MKVSRSQSEMGEGFAFFAWYRLRYVKFVPEEQCECYSCTRLRWVAFWNATIYSKTNER